MMIKRILAAAAYVLIPAVLYAHECWIAAENYFPAENTETRVYVCSGHGFPESETVISEILLDGIYIINPAGERAGLKAVLNSDKNCWQARASVVTGTYLAAFTLKRPQMKEPLLWGKAIIIAGADTGEYVTGEGLEIAPLGKLRDARVSGNLKLGLYNNGARISGVLNINPEKERAYTMRAGEENPADIRMSAGGRYLVTARHGRRTCSLTFRIPWENEQ